MKWNNINYKGLKKWTEQNKKNKYGKENNIKIIKQTKQNLEAVKQN